MKYLHLVWAGVWRRPGRAVLTMLSIVTAFLLFGLLQGLVSGIDNAVQATHADVLITQSKISQIDPLPISMLTRIRQVPGVKAATPLLAFPGTYQTARMAVPAYAVDPDTVTATDNDTGIPPEGARRPEGDPQRRRPAVDHRGPLPAEGRRCDALQGAALDQQG
jgi:hypothetical protein